MPPESAAALSPPKRSGCFTPILRVFKVRSEKRKEAAATAETREKKEYAYSPIPQEADPRPTAAAEHLPANTSTAASNSGRALRSHSTEDEEVRRREGDDAPSELNRLFSRGAQTFRPSPSEETTEEQEMSKKPPASGGPPIRLFSRSANASPTEPLSGSQVPPEDEEDARAPLPPNPPEVELERLFSRGGKIDLVLNAAASTAATTTTTPAVTSLKGESLERLFSRGAVPLPSSSNNNNDGNAAPNVTRLTTESTDDVGANPSDPLYARVAQNETQSGRLNHLFSRGAIPGVGAAAAPRHRESNYDSVESQSAASLATPAEHSPHRRLEHLFSRGAVRASSTGARARRSTVGSEESVEVYEATPNAGRSQARKTYGVNADEGSSEAAPASPSLPASTTTTRQDSLPGSSKKQYTPVRARQSIPLEERELFRRLPRVREQLVPGTAFADTRDQEDHTFCGIMFDVEARRLIPTEFIEIQSVFVRGSLGPVSVYRTLNGQSYVNQHVEPEKWVRVYGPVDWEPSHDTLVELVLDEPIRLIPGMKTGVYVHSTQPGDQAIVYADGYEDVTFENTEIRIMKAIAHTSSRAFSPNGLWGQAWRRNRYFVGRLRYGLKTSLWTPDAHYAFNPVFRQTVRTLLACHASPASSGLHRLPKELIFMILNFLPHDVTEDALKSAEEEELEADPELKAIRERERRFRAAAAAAALGEEEEDEDPETRVRNRQARYLPQIHRLLQLFPGFPDVLVDDEEEEEDDEDYLEEEDEEEELDEDDVDEEDEEDLHEAEVDEDDVDEEEEE